MKVAVVHNQVASDDAPDARDVLLQVEAVTGALQSLGHEPAQLECTLDLEAVKRELEMLQPQLVFNLVESLGGHGSMIHLFPALLDAMRLPYTGSSADTVRLTSNKIEAKRRMRREGLPTPDWFDGGKGAVPGIRDRRWIIKSLWEHASAGLDEDSIVTSDSASALTVEMARRSPVLGNACFAEEFIAGREFNLSLITGDDGPQVLPPAEINFDNLDPAKPRIVDYRAKWDEDSPEYMNTPRTFEFSDSDAALLDELEKLARQSWLVFNLGGYGRVDFRVDAENRPWILEVNANPCLSPDAGFAAALSRAGRPFEKAVAAIIRETLYSAGIQA